MVLEVREYHSFWCVSSCLADVVDGHPSAKRSDSCEVPLLIPECFFKI